MFAEKGSEAVLTQHKIWCDALQRRARDLVRIDGVWEPRVHSCCQCLSATNFCPNMLSHDPQSTKFGNTVAKLRPSYKDSKVLAFLRGVVVGLPWNPS